MRNGRRFAAVVSAIVVGSIAAVAAGLVSAIVLAVVDLYLTGHSLPSISRPLIATSSAADLILLTVSAIVGLGVGWAIWNARRS